ncbi:MAG: hypothetical protein JXA22_01155 [Candidatus Thermoplasmatota archaeon]|nr:hypothetical protein [Candidatus Thermoplasmatota archaeon]
MRLKVFTVALLFLFLTVLSSLSLPSPSEAISFDPYEIPPGAPRWFDLEDFDEKGDLLELTIVFKKTSNGSFQERPVDILILESYLAKRNPSIERARSDAIFIRENVETRLELTGDDSIVNPKNSRMSILFYNEQQEGDLENWDEATVKIRVDYSVVNTVKEESDLVLTLVLILLVIIIIAVMIALTYYMIKKRVRDTRTFFNPEAGLYYVFRDIDGSILYFSEEQYTQMYNQNALVTYEYLGQAMKKGGPIMTPVEEQGMYAEGIAPIFETPQVPVPLNSDMSQQLPAGQVQGPRSGQETSVQGMEIYNQDESAGARTSQDGVGPTEQLSEEGPAETATQDDGSGGVLDELVSSASTITEEASEEEMILRLEGPDRDGT